MIFNRYRVHLVISLAFLFSYALTFDEKIAPLGDNASYFLLGKALSEGAGFVDLMTQGNPAHNHYPIGYPILISSILWLAPGSIVLVKLFNGLLFLVALLVLYEILIKLQQSKTAALLITVVVATNSHLLFYSSAIMSEIPFLTLSLLSIWIVLSSNWDEQVYWRNPRVYLLIFALTASFYVRTAALALIFAILIHFLLGNRRKLLLTVVIGVLVLITPLIIKGLELGRSSYVSQLLSINPYRPALGNAGFLDFIERIGTNALRYINREIPNLIAPVIDSDYSLSPGFVEWVIGIVLTGLVIVALWKAPKRWGLLKTYVVLSFAVLFLWPSAWTGVRFAIAIMPFLFLFITHSISNLFGLRFSHVAITGFIVLNGFSIFELYGKAKAPHEPGFRNYIAMANWAGANIAADKEILCSKPAIFHLYSGILARRIPLLYDQDEVLSYLESDEVQYILIDRSTLSSQRILYPLLQEYRGRFEIVHQLERPDTYLVRWKQ